VKRVMLLLAALLLLLPHRVADAQSLRPPAVPLVAHDPYFSLWSMSDALPDDQTRHWTGTVQSLYSSVRVDGKILRLMGREVRGAQGPALEQKTLTVLPTRTIYTFSGAGVALTLTFLTPAFPDDLEVLSRPATYVTWDVASADGRPHDVAVYFDASSDLTVNTAEQPVTWGRFRLGPYTALRAGSAAQPVLEKSGDNLRIDWGYLYVVSPHDDAASYAGDRDAARASFADTGRLPDRDDFSAQRVAGRRGAALAFVWDLKGVTSQPASRHIVLAYDDGFSIEYFNRRLRPWWRRNGAEASDLLSDAIRDYDRLNVRARAFDDALMADLRRAGGEPYAQLAALAYRQTLAAHKLVADLDGTPLFSKENFSNGCIATVDVTYPSSPFFLLFSPALLRAMLTPIMDYASLPRWRFPFAPHDLGTYPQANGQVYGGGEKTEENQMPVEESGNMLLMVAALAQVEGNARYAERYWPLLTKWADYLKDKGFDPENQLSTDDFAGHLAHNANLSVKAILAIGAYAKLADMTGHRAEGASARTLAQGFVKKWTSLADDGGHYRLAFDKPGTWSQKYNLVWDRLLGLDLFPPEVARTEIAYYKTVQAAYGLPLDNRERYTKLDWILWTATLAESPADFSALVTPVYRFLNESASRVPMTDWYWTHDAKQRGFQARSVVGGVFVKMLADPEVWKKWASAGQAGARR
jgi:Glutaminase A six helical-hairpin domain/Domain of unknown function (DUF5127)/Domain of unknown function (DUF4964)